ncbi:glycosyltransferase family 4 protein [Candidatus Omnitrophota bacterium]
MSRKKILLVSNTSRSIYIFYLGLINGLRKDNFNVLLYAHCDEYAPKLTERGFKLMNIALDRKEVHPLKDLKLVFDLTSIYKREKPNLVLHCSIKPNIYGTFAAKMANVKCLNTVSGLGYAFMRKGFLSKFVSVLYRLSQKFASRVFFLNKDDLGFFLKNRIIKKAKTVLLNGPGVNTDYFCLDFCKKPKRHSESFIFLFVGRLLWHKGLGELVSASKTVKMKYPTTEFHLLGRIDKDNPSCVSEDTIIEWEDEKLIKYLGTSYDVRPYICQSDAVILPSYREGVPCSLLEAMAMGKPIITTDSVGCRDVVEAGKNGFIVPAKNPKALADSMIRLIELMPGERERMGRYGRKKAVEEFNETNTISSYIATIKNVLGQEGNTER